MNWIQLVQYSSRVVLSATYCQACLHGLWPRGVLQQYQYNFFAKSMKCKHCKVQQHLLVCIENYRLTNKSILLLIAYSMSVKHVCISFNFQKQSTEVKCLHSNRKIFDSLKQCHIAITTEVLSKLRY